MLNKNPDQNDAGFKIESVVDNNVLNSVMCSEPFTKSAFIVKLLNETDRPIVYLDFDLLYSGYLTADMIPSPKNLELFLPTKENWNIVIKDVISCVYDKRTLFVIDSLNGFFNLFYNKNELGRIINSYIMLFVCMAEMSQSHIIITSMVNKKDGEWTLSLLGRQALELKKMSKIFLEQDNLYIRLSVFSNTEITSHQIPISLRSKF